MRQKEAMEAMMRIQVMEPSVRKIRVNIHVTRMCAYRRWLPEMANKCQCWGCQLRREQFYKN